MKIPGMGLIKKAERRGNEIEVPVAENLGLADFFKLTYKEMNEDHVMAFAGNLTYKGLFALFPFFTFLLSLLGLFNATDLVNTMVDKLSGVAPQSATEFIEGQLLSITQSQAESAFTFGAIISILLALWGISGAFRSVMEAMNVMYEVEEDRPFWKVHGLSIFMSLAVVVLLVGALVLVVFGESIGVRRGRPRRSGVRLRDALEHRAVARRGLGRPLRLRHDLLLRPRRQTEVPLDQPRLHPRLRVLAHLLPAFSLYASTSPAVPTTRPTGRSRV